ncbi:MAG: nucleoside triphosphate pyrophosphohydrolase [Candidatus Aminicenantes bacterium]|nr:nucleoside triphosphate pyrophosphohydrolase [Candidatus Aminicenantes bacterium]
MIDSKQAGEKFQELVGILARLRGPDGCPWDREQTVKTLKDYFLEEVHEAIDALDRNDPAAAAEELGDVLMEVVFLSRVFEERGEFSVSDALESINDKMIRRHPHVYGGERLGTPDEVTNAWNLRKKKEKSRASHFDGIPATAPSLQAAFEIGKRAAAFGFDWPDAAGALDKVREELGELDRTIAEGDAARQAEEMGDCLFALACAARLLGIHPETALRRANAKFIGRFAALEDRLREKGKPLGTANLEEMESAWQSLKKERGVKRPE